MLRILTKRVQAKIEAANGVGGDQFRFRKDPGTRNAIGAFGDN